MLNFKRKAERQLQLSHEWQNVENCRYQQEPGGGLPGSVQAYPYGQRGKPQGHETHWTIVGQHKKLSFLMVLSKIKLSNLSANKETIS